MSGNIDVLAAAALAVLFLMVAVWLISIPLRNAGVIDIAWGIGFVVIAWISAATGDGNSTRSNLVVVMVAVWGARLAINQWWRSRGEAEHSRYESMRRRSGEGFTVRSLLTVFLFQGFLIWIVSLPVQLVMVAESPEVGAVGVAGVVLWGIGFFFESVGESQLARFRSRSDNAGLILESGLRRFARHPKHFGQLCVWWGIFLVTAETSDARFGIVGPIVMTIILVRASNSSILPRLSPLPKPHS